MRAHPVQGGLQPLELELLQLLPGHAFVFRFPIHRIFSIIGCKRLIRPTPVQLLLLLNFFPAQIGPLHILVGQQVLGRPLEDDLAGLQHIAAVGDLQGRPGVLLHQQDGVALLAAAGR